MLYRFWYRILQARHGDIENSSLVLAVAIEGIIKGLCASEHDSDAQFTSLVEEAKPSVEELAIDQRVRDSIRKHLEHVVCPKPMETMQRLVEQGVLTQEHVRSWAKLRNSGAHGAQLDDDTSKIEAHYRLYLWCLDMFYRLLFLALGYRGNYIDRTGENWPTSRFPPVDNVSTPLY